MLDNGYEWELLMRNVRIGGLYMPEEMIEQMHREIDKMRDPIYTIIEEKLKRTERERDEALKKECEKLQSEVEYLRKRNEELAKEFEEYKRRIDSIRNAN